MNTQKNYLAAGVLICLIAQSTAAQSIKNEIQIIEETYGIEKKQIIEQAMNLSGKEASEFWSLYTDYEDKRRKLGEERLLLVHDYVIAYPTLTDAKASEITSRCFKNDQALARLHKKYYKKVRNALSPLKAAQFVQAEGFLQNVIRIQIESRLPFIGEAVPIVTNISGR